MRLDHARLIAAKQEVLAQQTECARLQDELARLAKGGPRTEEGKRIASMNAVKTGLTGRTVLLPTDDAEAYRDHLTAYEREYQPVGLRESELVQSLADTQWRLSRIPGLESAIYAKGRHEFAEAHAAEELTLRKALIELDTHLKYEKQLRNLQLQESRLYRRYEKESAELRQLRKERQAREAAQPAAKPAAASAAGEFVFSNQVAEPLPISTLAIEPAESRSLKADSGQLTVGR